MKVCQMFVLMSAAYVAPHMPAGIGLVFGGICTGLAVYFLTQDK